MTPIQTMISKLPILKGDSDSVTRWLMALIHIFQVGVHSRCTLCSNYIWAKIAVSGGDFEKLD